MKKLIILFLTLTLSFPLFAQPDFKPVLGKWKYIVDTGGQGEMTGIIRITEVDGKLSGDATVDGNTIPFTKIELKDGNKLIIEMKTESDHYRVDIKVQGNKFSGMGSSYQGEAPISGEKLVE